MSVCDGRLSLVSFIIVVVAGEGVYSSEVGRRWYFLRIVRLRIGGLLLAVVVVWV